MEGRKMRGPAGERVFLEMAAEVPASVRHLITVNREFAVLLCSSSRCRHALTTKGVGEHFRKVHMETLGVRKDAKAFALALAVSDARFLHDHTNVELPVSGSLPQPVLRVVNGFSCSFCLFLTTSRDKARKHASKDHSKRYKEDERIFTLVSMQSWFGWKKERYWAVSNVATGLDKPTMGSNEAMKIQREATERFGKATNGFGGATKVSGEATNRSGKATNGCGETIKRCGEAMKRFGEATNEHGKATKGLEDTASESGDAINELNRIKADV